MDLNFEKMNGLIPAIIQDNSTNKVLMLGFMNEEAYRKTVETGKVTFFSRTKNRLWTKGEESGNFLNVVSIKEDCDKDTLLIKVSLNQRDETFQAFFPSHSCGMHLHIKECSVACNLVIQLGN